MMRGMRRTTMPATHWIPIVGAALVLLLATSGVRGESGALDTQQNSTVTSEQDVGAPALNKNEEKPELKDETPKLIQTDPTLLSPPLTTPPGKGPEPETETVDDGTQPELAASGSEQPLVENDEAKAVPELLAGNDDTKSVVGGVVIKGVPGENTTVAMATPEPAATAPAILSALVEEVPIPEVITEPEVIDLSLKNDTQMSSEKNTSKEGIVGGGDEVLNPSQQDIVKEGKDKGLVTEPNVGGKEEVTEVPVPGGALAGAGDVTTAAPPAEKPTSPPTDPPVKPEPTTTATTTAAATTTTPPPAATPIVVTVVPTVILPGKTDPPYVHVTESSTSATTPQNGTIVGKPGASTSFSPKVIAIIVGAALGLIVIIIIITVVVIVIKRKKRRDRHDIPIVENPRYMSANSQQAHNYRFSRDASLMIGGPHNLANNNHNEKNDMNSIRKKRRAPPAPNPFTGEVEGFPLNHDGVQYYEKDTPHGSEVELTTFGTKPHPEVHYAVPDDPAPSSTAATAGTLTDEEVATQNDFSDTDDDDANRSAEELEGRALLEDIEQETGYRIRPDSSANRKSVADKYRFSDDEEARDSSDYNRARDLESVGDSEEELDGSEAMHYDVSDIADVTDPPSPAPPSPAPPSPAPPKPPRTHSSAYDPSKNPFES